MALGARAMWLNVMTPSCRRIIATMKATATATAASVGETEAGPRAGGYSELIRATQPLPLNRNLSIGIIYVSADPCFQVAAFNSASVRQ